MRFLEKGEGGRELAEELSQRLAAWVGAPDPEPYSLLVDCSSIVDVDAGWRATWAEYFTRHRDAATIAWFNANARIRLIILMFIKGTGVRGRAFATEDEARNWLASQVGTA
jgi:hypothetical protein